MIKRIVLSVCFLLAAACGPAAGGAPDGGGAGTIVSSDSNGNCSPSADQVAVFVDANFDGKCVVLSTGDFANATATGLPDNSISSLKVGANVQAALCADADFAGKCATLKADDSSLADNSDIGDNTVSSIRVRTR